MSATADMTPVPLDKRPCGAASVPLMVGAWAGTLAFGAYAGHRIGKGSLVGVAVGTVVAIVPAYFMGFVVGTLCIGGH